MADRRKDASFSQGWGVAGFITALVVLAFVVAGTINSRTYHAPRDPLTPSTERRESHGPAGEPRGDSLDPGSRAPAAH